MDALFESFGVCGEDYPHRLPVFPVKNAPLGTDPRLEQLARMKECMVSKNRELETSDVERQKNLVVLNMFEQLRKLLIYEATGRMDSRLKVYKGGVIAH
ncbi:MAG: hypothetical protein WC050_03895 [Candidatus Paceibacterota bacterium]